MFYVGHFSFTGQIEDLPEDENEISGYFTCIMEAADVEEAGRRMRALIRETRRGSHELGGVTTVYLDSIIEVHSLPKKGILAYVETHLAPMPPSMSHVLPNTRDGYCESYTFGEPEDEDEEDEVIPFVTFEDTGQNPAQ